jgi:hypothetical protein
VPHRIGRADAPARFADLQKEPNLVKAVVDITDENLWPEAENYLAVTFL